MICERVQLPDGGAAMVCFDGRRKVCAVCGRARATKLCDGPAPAGSRRKTCDRPLCTSCAAHVEGEDLDFCDQHKELAMRGGPSESIADVLARARANAGVTEIPTVDGSTAPPATPLGEEVSSHATSAGKAGAQEPAAPGPAASAPTPAPPVPEEPAPSPALPTCASPQAAPHHDPLTCRSCQAPILWAQLIDAKGDIQRRENGRPKAIPVDYAPTGNGNVEIFDRAGSVVARVLNRTDAAAARMRGALLRTNHFMKCPHAESWRRS